MAEENQKTETYFNILDNRFKKVREKIPAYEIEKEISETKSKIFVVEEIKKHFEGIKSFNFSKKGFKTRQTIHNDGKTLIIPKAYIKLIEKNKLTAEKLWKKIEKVADKKTSKLVSKNTSGLEIKDSPLRKIGSALKIIGLAGLIIGLAVVLIISLDKTISNETKVATSSSKISEKEYISLTGSVISQEVFQYENDEENTLYYLLVRSEESKDTFIYYTETKFDRFNEIKDKGEKTTYVFDFGISTALDFVDQQITVEGRTKNKEDDSEGKKLFKDLSNAIKEPKYLIDGGSERISKKDFYTIFGLATIPFVVIIILGITLCIIFHSRVKKLLK